MTEQQLTEQTTDSPTDSRTLKPKTGKAGLSFRALLIGIMMVAVVCVIVSYAELVIGRMQIGFLQMPPAAIGIFFAIILLNRQMQKLGRRFSLNASELMMIYCMIVVAAMISSRGIMERLIPLMVSMNYFANSGNKWQELFFPHVKKWLVAFDPKGGPNQPVAQQFFEALQPGKTIPWGQWVIPLMAWGILVLLVIFAFLCLATILRKQWVDNEKLPFPLIQPPLYLVQEEQESLFKNRLLWGGIMVPTVVFTLNGLHQWYPAIPELTLQLFINPFLVNPPWDQMYYTCIFMSFAAVGFFFLLPSELLFSIWFFAMFARLQGVFAASLGMDIQRMPVYGTHMFVAYQTVGAYFVLAAYLLYVARPHLKRVVRTAFWKEKDDSSDELMPYRVAFWGLVLSFGLIMAWSVLAGMSLWLALLEFGVFLFVIALVMTRSTAEAGMLMTETTFRPIDLYSMFAPVSAVGPANITMLALFDTMFLREQRGLLLTGIMDGLKMSDGVKVRRRSFLSVFVVGIVAALLIAGYLHMALPYSKGGITMYEAVYRGHNIGPLQHYEGQFSNTTPPTWQSYTFFAVGVTFAAFLTYMRAMFYWWPLHPLGYALSVSWTSSVFWFSCLAAWILKTLILRYGGMRIYVKARPWFLGMIIGEFGMAVIWALIGAITGAPTPEFPWP